MVTVTGQETVIENDKIVVITSTLNHVPSDKHGQLCVWKYLSFNAECQYKLTKKIVCKVEQKISQWKWLFRK